MILIYKFYLHIHERSPMITICNCCHSQKLCDNCHIPCLVMCVDSTAIAQCISSLNECNLFSWVSMQNMHRTCWENEKPIKEDKIQLKKLLGIIKIVSLVNQCKIRGVKKTFSDMLAQSWYGLFHCWMIFTFRWVTGSF